MLALEEGLTLALGLPEAEGDCDAEADVEGDLDAEGDILAEGEMTAPSTEIRFQAAEVLLPVFSYRLRPKAALLITLNKAPLAKPG